MRQVTGRDVRMMDFGRSVLRGYAVGEVDDFLKDVAVALDRRDRVGPMHARIEGEEEAGARAPMSTGPTSTAPRPPAHARVIGADDPSAAAAHAAPTHTAPTHTAPAHAATQPEATQGTTPVPNREAEAVLAAARAEAADLMAQARASAEETVNDARESARRGLAKARERAHELLTEAAERRAQAARAETAAELKLAHVEKMLDEKAALIATEARRLDELAGRLAEHDLRPDDAGTDRPAHAVGDVVEFKR